MASPSSGPSTSNPSAPASGAPSPGLPLNEQQPFEGRPPATQGQLQTPPSGRPAEPGQESPYHWGMVVDLDRCTGCQACVVACQAENNVALNEEERFLSRRAKEWIRIERYWEGEYPDVKVHYLPVLCQQCGNAPCEPLCPVYATYHGQDGLNVQVYNRCIGTRYCGNGCQWNVRFFNFWQPEWPEPLTSQLNPDVTVRDKGVMEKCTFCIQRINRAERLAAQQGRTVRDGELQPACVQTCPTNTLIFGNLRDPNSRVNQLAKNARAYQLLGELGTNPSVIYLKKVDEGAPAPTPRNLIQG